MILLRAIEVLWTFFLLGISAFGGPVAHLGYFRRTFVDRKKWVDDEEYGALLSMAPEDRNTSDIELAQEIDNKLFTPPFSLSSTHDDDMMGDGFDYAQIVADEHITQGIFFLKFFEQVKNLRLHR